MPLLRAAGPRALAQDRQYLIERLLPAFLLAVATALLTGDFAASDFLAAGFFAGVVALVGALRAGAFFATALLASAGAGDAARVAAAFLAGGLALFAAPKPIWLIVKPSSPFAWTSIGP